MADIPMLWNIFDRFETSVEIIAGMGIARELELE